MIDNKYLENLLKDIQGNTNRLPEFLPTDGTLFTTSEYMKNITKQNSHIFRRYLNHLQYFIGLFDMKGDKEFNRLVPVLIRHALEYGRVGLTRLDNKLLPFAVVKLEYDIFGKIKNIKGTPIAHHYTYISNPKNLIDIKPEKCAILFSNYLSLPFIYFWGKVLENIEHLQTAAITGSIASIKKFKRNVSNNSSIISKIENESYLDPTNPTIINITSPAGYFDLINSKESNNDVKISTTGNNVEFSTVKDDTRQLWENLNSYMEFEYFQLNRRINTNKKNERNVSSEIATETINFDILDQEFKRYLLIFKEECSDNLGLNINIIDTVSELYKPEIETNIGGKDVFNE